MSHDAIRTRVAPSPTGAPHIGTAYMALFNYAFAHRHGGQFVLRIEDTDRQRSTPESEAAILAALRWTGIPWDEGPDIGGPHAPYRQSERTELYRRHAALLLEAGHAYPCFCTAERLADMRREQAAAKGPQGYDGRCAALAPAEARRRTDAGETHVVRMRVPREGDCVFNDHLRGDIRIPWTQVDHQVLLKSDGFPTYHLACVVDDHLMRISHVIRGEEWISSAPKHALLYRHFGWEPPVFVHLPLLRNPDNSKLSKRKNPTSILYYRDAGFLPEAVVNFLGLMAYSLPDGREDFTLADLVETFDLDRISLGGPIFDLQKLRHFNARSIRRLPPGELWRRFEDWKLNPALWSAVLPLAQPRLDTLADLVPSVAFLFADRLDYDAGTLLGKAAGEPANVAARFKLAQWELETLRPWNGDAVDAMFRRLAENESVPLKTLLGPFFVAMTGAPVSLPLFDSMALLGRDLVLRRIAYALDVLDAAGTPLKGKALKRLEKDYQARYPQPGDARDAT